MSVKRQYVQCIVVYNHLRSSRLTWVVSPFIPMFAIRSVGPPFYELKLQKAHAFRHGMNAAYFFF